MSEHPAWNNDVLRLLKIGEFKKHYLEKSIMMKTKVNPILIKALRAIEDGLYDVTELNLERSELDDDQVLPIIDALKKDTVIESLNLAKNNIRCLDGFISLLRTNTTLTVLDLSDNPIDTHQIHSLIQAANENEVISIINLRNVLYPDDKKFIRYFFERKKSTNKLVKGISDSKGIPHSTSTNGRNSLQDTKHFSQNSAVSASNSLEGTTFDSQSTASSRSEQSQTAMTCLSSAKMSRMEWITHLKKVFDELKRKSSDRKITKPLFIEWIYLNILKFPLVNEHIYEKTNTEIGFSPEEIIYKLAERSRETVSFDDILDTISQLNHKFARPAVEKMNSNHPNGIKATRKSPTPVENSKYHVAQKEDDHRFGSVAKATKGISLKDPSPIRAQKMNTISTRQVFLYPTDKKTRTSLGKTPTKTKKIFYSNHMIADCDGLDRQSTNKNVLAELSVADNSCQTPFSILGESTPGLNSRHKKIIQDRILIDRIQRRESTSNWTAPDSIQSEFKRREAVATVVKISKEDLLLKTQTPTKKMITLIDKACKVKDENSRRVEKASGHQSNTTLKEKMFDQNKEVQSLLKTPSAKMLKHFLSTKIQIDSSKKIEDTSESAISATDTSNNPVVKRTSIDRPGSSQKSSLQKMSAVHSFSARVDKSPLSKQTITNARNAQVNKELIDKDSEAANFTPCKQPKSKKSQVDKFADDLTPTKNQSVSKTNPESAKRLRSSHHKKFLELLTNFNTFYNENSSLLADADIQIINMLNQYSIMKDESNNPKVSLMFSNLASLEVKDLIIYPLLKTMLSYVDVLRIERSSLSQDSFSELIPESLIILNLSRNNISELRCLRTCRNLEFVNLSKNQIAEVKGFIMCPKLREVILSSNKLRNIKNLSKLSELRLVDLSHNQIEDESAFLSLQNNSQLAHINLKGNPISLDENYEERVFQALPQVKSLDTSIQDVSAYSMYFDFAIESSIEESSFPKKLSTSKSSSSLNTSNTAVKGVLKNTFFNLNVSGISYTKSYTPSRSITPGAVRKTCFLYEEDSKRGSSNRDQKSGEEQRHSNSAFSEDVLTITLDINNLPH